MMNHMDTNKPENDRSVDDVEGNPSRDAAASPPDGPYGAHQSWSARNPIAGPVPSTGPAAHPVGFTPPPPLSPPPSPPGPVGYPPTALMPPRDAVAAPRRGRALWAIVAAVALALGSGSVGGVVGYTMASSESTGSPSQMVADGATLADVAEQVQPSVVSIVAGEAGGSGVVFDDDGHIITNSHVVTAARGEVEVTFSDGTSAPAQIVGTDEAGDIAVLKVDGNLDLTPIPIGDSDALSVGDTVLALGSPLGLEGSVTSGIVSALDRTITDGGTTLNGLIQTDASINQGNSGGALVDGNGELVGINTAIATTDQSGGSIGLGFAIPSTAVVSSVEDIIANGDVERAFLGVSMNDSPGEGAVVTQVQPGSPADTAGLERDDVITAVDKQPVATGAEVAAAIQQHKPGAEVTITYKRDGRGENDVSVTLATA